MKHKVSELTGGLLDAAVCLADGRKFQLRQIDGRTYCSRWEEADYGFITSSMAWEWFSYQPSTSWATGGPIIERERLHLKPVGNTYRCYDYNATIWEYGPTPLIAAMRCYVASKLGGEVEIPEELT